MSQPFATMHYHNRSLAGDGAEHVVGAEHFIIIGQIRLDSADVFGRGCGCHRGRVAPAACAVAFALYGGAQVVCQHHVTLLL